MSTIYENYKKKHPEERCNLMTLDNIVEEYSEKINYIPSISECLVTTLEGLVKFSDIHKAETQQNFLDNSSFEANINHTKKVVRDCIICGAINYDKRQYFININNIVDVGYVNDGNQVLKVKEGFNPYYVWYMLNNDKKVSFEILNFKYSGFNYLQINLNKIQMLIPSLDYQNYFVDMMNGLDKRILGEKQLINKLKDIKSALLGKIFPKDGVNVPELRFRGTYQKEVNGEWIDISKREYDELNK